MRKRGLDAAALARELGVASRYVQKPVTSRECIAVGRCPGRLSFSGGRAPDIGATFSGRFDRNADGPNFHSAERVA
jgi:hypothetical protein